MTVSCQLPAVYSLKKELCTLITNCKNLGSVCPEGVDPPQPELRRNQEMETNNEGKIRKIRKIGKKKKETGW
jgi:hypothetical protein